MDYYEEYEFYPTNAEHVEHSLPAVDYFTFGPILCELMSNLGRGHIFLVFPKSEFFLQGFCFKIILNQNLKTFLKIPQAFISPYLVSFLRGHFY